ncbi:methyltransferase [Sphingobacterium sp. lm-10]|uniref:tRNA1(Val) (adenine(37)-N6)-methyltransferase n=1 Tax=Sphingobacterium sp. lm-10 TaxID=2944904 RepID=UPI002020C323|nr:methyltransferase [Sphingobacterium sp. lm-10]MCL7989021.1 methyltransferase [Sphingobacterium sp. lm-10]
MSVFRFKAFSVDQTGCAMRINTDGVLLGAITDAEDANTVLDIGTGTGVIALMLAQRFAHAQVIGLEIDESSAVAATKNAAQSPFSDRVQVWHGTFQEFEPANPIDMIVSNPPFYINTLHNSDVRKKQARHTDMAFFEDLLRYAQAHLSSTGAMEMILPPELSDAVIAKAYELGFFLQRTIAVSSFADSPCIRCIIRLSLQKEEVQTQRLNFVIYESKGVYSAAYRKLLQPFFLAF